jgi:hypothetical protein
LRSAACAAPGNDRASLSVMPGAYNISTLFAYRSDNRWMWLPSEEIGLNSGQVVVGFVLDDDGDWGSLLRDRDHTIMRIKTDTIETRMICQFRSTSPAVRASMLRIIATWVGRPISSKVPFCQSPNQSSGGLAAFSPVG